jgi:uncharacterized membrane protein
MKSTKPYPLSEKIRNFFSVVFGVLFFVGLLFALFPLFAGINQWLSGEKTGSVIEGIYFFSFGLLALNGFLSGMFTYLVSTRKRIFHAFLTGIVLTILYALALGKNIVWSDIFQSTRDAIINLAVPLILLLFPWLGGWAASRLKPRGRSSSVP